MSIGKNIAKYRKEKGFTQEELGAILGVSNQAVSKWENEVSMPDVMLLPQIANTLGITLNMLYGQESNICERVTADEFPSWVYNAVVKLFYDQSGCKFGDVGKSRDEQISGYLNSLQKGNYLTCISDTAGAVSVGRDFAFIDTTYKLPKSQDIFGSAEISNVLEILSDAICRKILLYQYKVSFAKKCTENIFFTHSEICKGCDLTERETLDGLNKLTLLGLEEKDIQAAYGHIYYFKKSHAMYALGVFKISQMLTHEITHRVLRDTSSIDDYAFGV